MKRNYLLLTTFLFAVHFAEAQSLAINTDGSVANASALLDVKSTGKGILIPRMAKTERNAIASPATGLLVFQNAPDSTGFYYYEGSKWNWVAAINGNADSIAWKRNGNAGTNPATDFIGTKDNQVLNFRVNNIKSGMIDNVNYNSAFGFKGLLSNSSATHNTAVGFESMISNTTGNYNTSVGAFSFHTNTTGIRNTAMGTSALYFSNANDNTAVGYEALNQSSSASATNNSAFGSNALRQNVSGNRNIAIGAYSLNQLITDSLNIVMGDSAAYATKGSRNVILGSKSALSLTNGSSNTIIGDNAANKITAGSNNVLIGDNAGRLATSSPFNAVVIGTQAGDTSIANWSTVVGNLAGRRNTAIGNTMIGSSAGENNTTGGMTAVGDNAGKFNTTGGLTAVGSYAGRGNTTGYGNTFVGAVSGFSNTTGNFNSFFGESAGYLNTGQYNTFSGYYAGGNNTTANYNSFYGYNAGSLNTTGANNTFTGALAGKNNITGSANSFYGDNAGYTMKNSTSNALFGTYALGFYCDTSAYNAAFGVYAAAYLHKGNNNAFFGYNTANNLAVGNDNTVLGYQAGVGDTADQNVCIGSFAGGKGDENVFIGHDAGKNNSLASMDGSTYIGSWAGFFKRASYSLLLGYSSSVLADGYSNASAIGAFSRVDTSNAMVLGSSGINVGIGITKPYQAKLTIAGSGNTLGIFGLGQAGISLQQNGPTIGYNQYRDISAGNATRYMANGYAWVNYMDQASGNMYWNSMPSGTANAAGGAETVRMTVTNTGSLGLNVIPNGTGALQFQNTLDNRKIVLWENANTTIDFYGFGINSGTLRYQVPAAGNVHSFVAGNTVLLNIFGTGNATLAGTLTQLSDVRLKENIVPINSTLNDLKKINAYSYYWKDENKDRDQQIGLLAQEVEKVFPQLVKKDEGGLLGVNYSGFVPLLIKGMQEQQLQIEELKKEIEKLTAVIKK